MEPRPEITKKHKKMHLSRYRNRWGWLLISPAVSGLTLWVALPLLVSLVASLCDWDMVGPPQYIGLNNYKMMFTVDPSFWQAVGVTAYYTFAGVPVQIIVAFVTALLLNTNVRGIRFFRTLYYLPSILPIAVNSVLWLWLFNPHFGLLNIILEWFGFPPQRWVFGSETVIPSFILMSLWSVGSTVIIFLAGLQGIPRELLEAVEIDGGSGWHRFRHIILPLMTPIIFYTVVIGFITGVQTFTQPFMMTGGGPANASLFYVLHLYRQAFQFSHMGYACAMAWFLFVVTMIISGVIFKSSSLWVFYEGEVKK